MSAEGNKEKVRHLYEEAYGKDKIEVVDEVLHSDFACYDPNSVIRARTQASLH